MNREDIIRMAREAGFSMHDGIITGGVTDLERFFQAAYAAGAAAEREACAKVCEDLESVSPEEDNPAPWCIAAAIRARGDTK